MALADAKHPAYLDAPGKFHTLLLSLVERAATTRRNIALRAEAVQEMEADDGKPVTKIARVRYFAQMPDPRTPSKPLTRAAHSAQELAARFSRPSSHMRRVLWSERAAVVCEQTEEAREEEQEAREEAMVQEAVEKAAKAEGKTTEQIEQEVDTEMKEEIQQDLGERAAVKESN
jgi:hypothetical protein